MAVEALKVKSMRSDVKESELKQGGVTRFISFEAAIQLFHQMYGIKDKPKGYRVTNEGIEPIYD